MNRINQESVAWRNQSFDTELPGEARAELIRPRRSRILGDPKRAALEGPAVKSRLYLVTIVTALLIGAAATTLWHQWNTERAKSTGTTSQPVASQPAPGPTVSPWREYIAQHPEQFPYANGAPRATLVKLPPPRAQLIRLPEWRVGEERQLLMPYGLKVLGRLKGCLAAEWMLPQEGNVIGETWIVGETPWVWVCPVGGSVPTWIDP